MTQSIQQRLFALQDLPYRDFQRKLIPNIDPETIIGVRTPALRQMAKGLTLRDLGDLPHRYFEENQLHGFVISGMKDFDGAVAALERFLPQVDNRATCDQMSPRCFRSHRGELIPLVRRWLASGHPYTVRFGIKMLMDHFLDGDFQPEYLEWVARVASGEYYVRMMQAWYFATALAKQFDGALPYIAQRCLEPWTHQKAIQKSLESFRISRENKEILKQYRIK